MLVAIIKIICLLVAGQFGFVNFASLIRGQDISAINILLMNIGIIGFVFMKFRI